jgi:hypothetical protein
MIYKNQHEVAYCVACHQNQPISMFYKNREGRVYGTCKACRKHNRETRETSGHKRRCQRCHEWKTPDEFPQNKRGDTMRTCKACKSEMGHMNGDRTGGIRGVRRALA